MSERLRFDSKHPETLSDSLDMAIPASESGSESQKDTQLFTSGDIVDELLKEAARLSEKIGRQYKTVRSELNDIGDDLTKILEATKEEPAKKWAEQPIASVVPLFSRRKDNPTSARHWTETTDDDGGRAVAISRRDLETFFGLPDETKKEIISSWQKNSGEHVDESTDYEKIAKPDATILPFKRSPSPDAIARLESMKRHPSFRSKMQNPKQPENE